MITVTKRLGKSKKKATKKKKKKKKKLEPSRM